MERNDLRKYGVKITKINQRIGKTDYTKRLVADYAKQNPSAKILILNTQVL